MTTNDEFVCIFVILSVFDCIREHVVSACFENAEDFFLFFPPIPSPFQTYHMAVNLVVSIIRRPLGL
jgi:hypothetical protein